MERNSRIKSIHPLSGLSSWEIEAAERLMHLSESSSSPATSISSSNTIIDDQDQNLLEIKTMKKRRKQKDCRISNYGNADPSSSGILLHEEAAAMKEIINRSSTEEVNSEESPSSCCSSSTTSNLSLEKRKQWIEEIFGCSDSDIVDDHNGVGFVTNRKRKPKKYRTLVQIYKEAELIAMI